MCKCLCLCVFLCACYCSASTLTVNLDGSGDFTDIQSAINAAGTGDIVEIADGVYSGAGNQNISFLGKSITVKSINGPDNCIVEGASSEWDYNRGFIFQSNETDASILEGITIRKFWLLTCCDGGAGICIKNGTPTIRSCVITNCHIQTDNCPCIIFGGGAFVSEGVGFFENCIIKNNSSFWGGGVSSSETNASTVVLNNCLITDNFASEGGGVWGGLNDTIFLSNCIIVNNYGGGIYLYNAGGKNIKQCTIAYNDYGICAESGRANLTRSIIWKNYNYQINFVPMPPFMVNSNYMSDHDPPYLDPKFVDPLNRDYHLQWDSPCIDFCNYAAPDPGDIDYDGEPRSMGQYVDAGADEVGPKQADFSRNGKIDLVDFEIFSSAWGTVPGDADWYLLCDLAEDDVIDLSDLQQLCADWLWQADWYE